MPTGSVGPARCGVEYPRLLCGDTRVRLSGEGGVLRRDTGTRGGVWRGRKCMAYRGFGFARCRLGRRG